jgi:hypothetical protein
VHIPIAADAVLAGNADAVATARSELHRALDRYAGCFAGVVLAFGHGPTLEQGNIQDGVDLAAAVVRELRAEFPDLTGGAVIETAADLDPPRDQVDLRLYFFAGCPQAEGA